MEKGRTDIDRGSEGVFGFPLSMEAKDSSSSPQSGLSLSSAERSEEQKLPFSLAKFLSYFSLALVLASSVVLAVFIGHAMTSSVLESQQEYALLLADNMNKQVFRKFTLPVAYASGEISLADPVQYKLLDDVIRSQLHGLQLDSVRIYNKHHTVLYSTDAEEVHSTKNDITGITSVYKGETHHFDVLSSVSFLKAFISPSLEKDSYRLRTLFPLTIDPDFKKITLHGRGLPVLGVIEFVQDMTSRYQSTIRMQRLIVALFLCSSLLLFFFTHFIARKAEFILGRRMARNRQLENQLHQAEKLASMGRMVASIAHEIRNPLGIIRSSAEFLIRRPKSEDPVQQAMLSAIYDESCRLGTTVTDFLDYARPRQPKKESVNISDLVNKALAFLGGRLQSAGVEVQLRIDSLFCVVGDPDLLYRAVYNILSNAEQAMPDGGSIGISSTISAGNLILDFHDSGQGFNEEALQKAGDPFFTTKETGTGLGLPIVRSIAEAHGGTLRLGNAAEGGAVVSLVLPQSEHLDLKGDFHE